MSDVPFGPVIAGYDSSPAAAAALEVAAAEAVAGGVTLQVVHAYPWPILYATMANLPYDPGDWTPAPATGAAIEAAVSRVRARHPGLVATVAVRAGRGGEVLIEASRHAGLLVVGARGAGGIAGLLSGSVVSAVTAHAHCPVLVVRPVHRAMSAGGEVCVGVDGSSSSLGAARFAFGWAARHGATVRVVRAVGPDELDGPAERQLRDWVEQARVGQEAVPVEVAVVGRAAPDALLAASRGARLVVVGSRHRGELASIALGSVGHTLIRRSAAPVVVTHGWGEQVTGEPARTADVAA